jgi:hypothetical protein
VPQRSGDPSTLIKVIVVQGWHGAGNWGPNWETFEVWLEEVFKIRADCVVFIRGDVPVEFGVVARVIDDKHQRRFRRLDC